MRGFLLGIVAVGALAAACGPGSSASEAPTPAADPQLRAYLQSIRPFAAAAEVPKNPSVSQLVLLFKTVTGAPKNLYSIGKVFTDATFANARAWEAADHAELLASSHVRFPDIAPYCVNAGLADGTWPQSLKDACATRDTVSNTVIDTQIAWAEAVDQECGLGADLLDPIQTIDACLAKLSKT